VEIPAGRLRRRRPLLRRKEGEKVKMVSRRRALEYGCAECGNRGKGTLDRKGRSGCMAHGGPKAAEGGGSCERKREARKEKPKK